MELIKQEQWYKPVRICSQAASDAPPMVLIVISAKSLITCGPRTVRGNAVFVTIPCLVDVENVQSKEDVRSALIDTLNSVLSVTAASGDFDFNNLIYLKILTIIWI